MSRSARTLFTILLVWALPLSAYAALININTADATLLDTLPGVGPTKAAAIVSYRQAHGPFASVEDIQKVSGIGPATFAKLNARITVDTTVSVPLTPAAPQGPVQPQAAGTSSQQVQTVVPVSSPNAKAHVQNHTAAPRETGTAASRGAAVAAVEPAVASDTARAVAEESMPAPQTPPAGGGLRIWLVGLLAVVVLAGGAFMIV